VTTSLAAEGADVRGMFNRVARRYDAANRVMSAGVDILWRKKAIRWLAEGLRVDGAGEQPRILDLGAGTLDGALEIARRIPGAHVFGADFAREMLRVGREKIPAGAAIETHAADGHRLPYRDCAFDGAFSAFCVRNFADLPVAMRELRRVVRPGGRLAILEFFRPERPRFFFDKIYNGRVLPLVGWAVTGDRDAYRYLPQSTAYLPSEDELRSMLTAAGFSNLRKERLGGGAAQLLTATR
jgi:demethylmenaquinone methyltransferase/2-methoxy-6-polyprenyl-1,4-benzoquinol methylase